jgi:hypothetical protein
MVTIACGTGRIVGLQNKPRQLSILSTEGLRMAEADNTREFFASVQANFDTTAPLGWNFMLKGAVEDHVRLLMDILPRMGFPRVEPLADQDEIGRYIMWFQEVCVHTSESFAARVTTVEQLAAREVLELWDYSASRAEEDAGPASCHAPRTHP